MSTTFKFFEGTATVNSTTPRVTVRKSGQLVLTEAAVAMLGEGVEQVQIGYNVGWYKLGLTPEEIAERIGHLSLAQVHAALTYYHANQRQIDEEIATDDAEAEALEREHLTARTDR